MLQSPNHKSIYIFPDITLMFHLSKLIFPQNVCQCISNCLPLALALLEMFMHHSFFMREEGGCEEELKIIKWAQHIECRSDREHEMENKC